MRCATASGITQPSFTFLLPQLTHNVHGPHDEKFYKFLSELEDEFEALKRSGYDGEGFHSRGHRVGQHVSHNLPPHIARARALEAAEKRRKVGSMLGGARKLGGVVRRDLTPRELAVQVSLFFMSLASRLIDVVPRLLSAEYAMTSHAVPARLLSARSKRLRARAFRTKSLTSPEIPTTR